jgi:hypothetical protein
MWIERINILTQKPGKMDLNVTLDQNNRLYLINPAPDIIYWEP